MDPLIVRLVTCQVPDGLPAGSVSAQSNTPAFFVPVVGVATVQLCVAPPGPVIVTVAVVTPVPASSAPKVKLVVSGEFVIPESVFGPKLNTESIGAGDTVTRE